MARLDISGTWTLHSEDGAGVSVPARVPGDNASALLEAGLIPDPDIGTNEKEIQWIGDRDWTWSGTFELDDAFLAQRRIWISIDSIDTDGEVLLNGRVALKSEDMFIRARADVKRLLRRGVNRIDVRTRKIAGLIARKREEYAFRDGSDDKTHQIAGLTMARKIQCQGGWDWGLCNPVCGIYGDVCLEGSGGVRLEHVWTEQRHSKGLCKVTVTVEIDSARAGEAAALIRFNGEEKTARAAVPAGVSTLSAGFLVRDPELWNPAGYGRQPLYDLEVETDGQKTSRKIGLRKLEVVSKPDSRGVGLKFRVNGTDVFAKGANWIPASSFPGRHARKRYEELLGAAAEANMNMIRVWGGGLYENDAFYETCDRLGLLVWQDLMFACMSFPMAPAFRELVAREATYQVKRLRDHASIALWCGDNECICFWGWAELKRYDWLLGWERSNQALQAAVSRADPTRLFWPSSPCGGPGRVWDAEDPAVGDTHHWSVWHGRKDIETYRDTTPRFCSEFGFEGFSSMDTILRFTGGEGLNATSPVMEHHNRSPEPGGAVRIADTMARYFRVPSGFEAFVYVSQALQAFAISAAVGYWRSRKPVCMGTLYWQLNDYWPVTSCSSIDYYGHWKQLHYHVKRLYDPVAVTGYEKDGKVEFHAVSDLREPLEGTLRLETIAFSGELVRSSETGVSLKPGEAKRVARLRADALAPADGGAFVHMTLSVRGRGKGYLRENDWFPVRFKRCALEEARIVADVSEAPGGGLSLTLAADKPAFFVFARFRGIRAVFDDNSITLLPGRPVSIPFRADGNRTVGELRRALEVRDLRGSYQEGITP